MSRPYEGMNAVLYARVSTEKASEKKRQNTKSQILELRRFCEENGIEILGEYSDEITGTTIDRPELDRMIGRVAKGGVNMILALHPDRISRDMEGKAELLKIVKPYGTVVRYLSDMSLKPETEDGRVIDTINTYGGQKYVSGHGIKIKAGFARVEKEGTKSGKPIGRPAAVIPIDLVMQCAAEGRSLNNTAELLSIGRETLRRYLINVGRLEEFYERTGKYITDDVLSKNGQKVHRFLNDGNPWTCPKTPLPDNTDSSYTSGEKRGDA